MSISNSTNSVLSKSGSILRALDATSNWRALLVTASSFLVAAIVMVLGGLVFAKTFSTWMIAFFSIVAFLLLTIGISATGFMMMDSARGAESRGWADALISSIFSVHRYFLSLLVLIAAYLVWMIVLSLVLLVCKIPGLGATLYTAVFPLAILISGIFTIFMFYAGAGILWPSIWDDGSVMQTMARLWMVAKERFMSLVILSLLLSLLVSVVAGLVFGVFASGTLITAALSGLILGSSINPMELLGFMSGLVMGGGMQGSGYGAAMVIGGGMLFLLFMAIPANVSILGFCINYLQLTDGLDLSEAQKQIQSGLDEAKRRAEAAKARAEEMQRQRVAQQASQQTAVPEPSQPLSNAQDVCAVCGAPTTLDDMFCGGCGNKLK